MKLWESKYDDWKLRSRDDELDRKRIGHGGKYGTVEYTYMVENIGKCPCCDENILEDNMFVEEDDGTLYHFSCYNYKKAEEDRRNGK